MEQPKPTVIGHRPISTVRPTAIPSSPVAPAVGEEKILSGPKPTAIPSSTLSVPTVSKPAAPVMVIKPSAIPGTVRTHISMTRQNLQAKYPSNKETVIEKALTLILTTSPDVLTTTAVVTWGQPLQMERGNLANVALSYAKSEVMTTVSAYLNRMFEILEKIRLDKVFEKKVNVLFGALRKASAEIDTPEELDEAFREIEQLSVLMQARLSDLLELREKFNTNANDHDVLADNLEVSIIAASVVADYLSKQEDLQRELVSRFSERIANLTLTLGQIRSDSPMRRIHTEQPMEVISLIQDVVFNTLPTWISSVTSMRMMLQGNTKPTATEIGEISRALTTILQKKK